MYVLDIVYVNVAVHDGIYCEGRNTLYAEFVHDITAVGNYRCKPNVQFVGNLFIDVSLYNKREHF